jgi:hypothetical protein
MPTTSAQSIFPAFRTVILLSALVVIALLVVAPFLIAIAAAAGEVQPVGSVVDGVSPIFGVTIPDGYRQWELVAPAEEAVPLNELRAVLGSKTAISAYHLASRHAAATRRARRVTTGHRDRPAHAAMRDRKGRWDRRGRRGREGPQVRRGSRRKRGSCGSTAPRKPARSTAK